MEYEIEDEPRLFDDSTNPSLQRRHHAPARTIDRRRPQRAVLIPDEEDQAA